MTTNEIKSKFSINQIEKTNVDFCLVTDIGSYVQVSPKIDENKETYYLSIDIIEMSKSSIPNDIINQMVENGWHVSKDKKNIVKIC